MSRTAHFFLLVLGFISIGHHTFALPVGQAAPSGLAGAWEGAVDIAGTKLAIAVAFTEGPKGLTATIDIQGAKGLPLQAVRRDGAKVHFELAAGLGLCTFEGTFDGVAITGTFTQGLAAARSRAAGPRSNAQPCLLVRTRAPEHAVLVVGRRVEDEIAIHVREPELRQVQLATHLVEDQFRIRVVVVPSEPGDDRHRDRRELPGCRSKDDPVSGCLDVVDASLHGGPPRDEREVDCHLRAALGLRWCGGDDARDDECRDHASDARGGADGLGVQQLTHKGPFGGRASARCVFGLRTLDEPCLVREQQGCRRRTNGRTAHCLRQ